jgi:hypothetical protein
LSIPSPYACTLVPIGVVRPLQNISFVFAEAKNAVAPSHLGFETFMLADPIKCLGMQRIV